LPWFMWKTGTSSGRRDAWAIGQNGRFAVGVWVGRFRGTGRYEYVGSRAAEPLLAQLFLLPELKNNSEPHFPDPLVVQNPLPVPDRIDKQLHILSPENGEVFIAYTGEMQIYPKANQTVPLHWFLNGILQKDTEQPLEVSPGYYKLRCVNQQGNSSVVAFSVQSN
jgi:membrane carboxypeptidase/penicillin-binding protein PbpC